MPSRCPLGEEGGLVPALVPVVEGAGGRVTDWQGNKMRPDGDGRTLAVGDPALLPQVLAVLAS